MAVLSCIQRAEQTLRSGQSTSCNVMADLVCCPHPVANIGTATRPKLTATSPSYNHLMSEAASLLFRPDNRLADALRPTRITPGYIAMAEGSVLIEAGNTRVLCNATVEQGV